MTKSSTRSRAHREESSRPRALTIFEVDEYGTLRQRGVRDPETHADLYPEIDPRDIRTGQDALELAERHPGMVGLVMRLIEDERDEVAARLERLPAGSARRRKLSALVEQLTDQMDDWTSWLEALPPERLQPVRDLVAGWLSGQIDWSACDVPMHAGAQGEALSWFESFTSDVLDELGVAIVYGEHPGSTYYAAELQGDIDAANRKAEELGLDIRFVQEGGADEEPACEAAKREEASCSIAPGRDTTDAVPAAVVPAVEAQEFLPLFGVGQEPSSFTDSVPHDPVPAPDLRHLHLGGLFASAWQRIVGAIREPVAVHVDARGHRHLHIVGGAVYTCDPTGRWSGRLWLASDSMTPALTDYRPANLTLDGVPAGWLWMDRWERAFALEVAHALHQQARPVTSEEAERYARWAFGVFRNRIRSGCDLRTMRRRVAAALALDPLVLDVARQLCLTERTPRVTMALYNRVMDHLAAHRKLVKDGSGLQLTYALLCHDASGAAPGEHQGSEPLQRLRQRLAAQDLQPRTGRMLLKGGTAIWRPMVRFYRPAGTQQAWDYLRLLDRLRWRGAPDPAFMQLLLAQVGSSDRPRDSYEPFFMREARVLRSIVARYEAQGEAGRADMRVDLPVVLSWTAGQEAVPVCAARRPPPWATLVRKARAFISRRLAVARLCPGPWPCPQLDLSAASGSPYVVEPVLTPDDLLYEGLVMRHCALRYARECIQGSAFIASVRDRQSGRRIATALWTAHADGWSLTEVVGFANGPVPDRVRQLVNRLKPAS